MKRIGLPLLLLQALRIRHAHAATNKDCDVSPWEEWGPCIGNCDFALRVRNRDVKASPFPKQRHSDEMWVIQPCPQLYQVVACKPNFCEGGPGVQRLSNLTIRDDFLGPLPPVERGQEAYAQRSPHRTLPKSSRDLADEKPYGSGGELAPLIVLPDSPMSDPSKATAESRSPKDILRVSRKRTQNIRQGRFQSQQRRRPAYGGRDAYGRPREQRRRAPARRPVRQKSITRQPEEKFFVSTTPKQTTPHPTTNTARMVDRVLSELRPSLVWSDQGEDRLFENGRPVAATTPLPTGASQRTRAWTSLPTDPPPSRPQTELPTEAPMRSWTQRGVTQQFLAENQTPFFRLGSFWEVTSRQPRALPATTTAAPERLVDGDFSVKLSHVPTPMEYLEGLAGGSDSHAGDKDASANAQAPRQPMRSGWEPAWAGQQRLAERKPERFQNYRSAAIPRTSLDLRRQRLEARRRSQSPYQPVPRAALILGKPAYEPTTRRPQLKTRYSLLRKTPADVRNPFSIARRWDSIFWDSYF